MMGSRPPSLSLVIATRNRAAGIGSTLASVEKMDPAADEVIVIDQSTDDETCAALQDAMAAGRIRYQRQRAVGLSQARNLGIAKASGDLVGFTDDDCEVDGSFASSVRSALARHPEVGLLFGTVASGDHDKSSGLIPHCSREDEFVARAMLDQRQLGGMGACMVARKSCLEKLAGFDPCLGAGAKFPAADETDLTLRALAAGIPVLETPAVKIIHQGFRTWAEAETLSDKYLRGTGAMFAKHLRLHPGQAGLLLLSIVPRWMQGRSRITYQRAPRRLARLSAFAHGWVQGMGHPMDRRRGLFLAP